jgi:hypothetical protein
MSPSEPVHGRPVPGLMSRPGQARLLALPHEVPATLEVLPRVGHADRRLDHRTALHGPRRWLIGSSYVNRRRAALRSVGSQRSWMSAMVEAREERRGREPGPHVANRPPDRDADPGALVAISPTYGFNGTVFAGTDSGLFVTRDARGSWTAVQTAPSDRVEPNRSRRRFTDYRNDQTVLVSTRQTGLLLSTDGAESFRQVGTELLAANHLVADFNNPTSGPIQFSQTFQTERTIFAYAQTRLLRSIDGGGSWEIVELPESTDVLESLDIASRHAPKGEANGQPREAPIGNLSRRRVLVAAVAGAAFVLALTALGVGGRRTGTAHALHLDGAVVALALTLLALAK